MVTAPTLTRQKRALAYQSDFCAELDILRGRIFWYVRLEG